MTSPQPEQRHSDRAGKIVQQFDNTNWDTDMGADAWLEQTIAQALASAEEAGHARGVREERERLDAAVVAALVEQAKIRDTTTKDSEERVTMNAMVVAFGRVLEAIRAASPDEKSASPEAERVDTSKYRSSNAGIEPSSERVRELEAEVERLKAELAEEQEWHQWEGPVKGKGRRPMSKEDFDKSLIFYRELDRLHRDELKRMEAQLAAMREALDEAVDVLVIARDSVVREESPKREWPKSDICGIAINKGRKALSPDAGKRLLERVKALDEFVAEVALPTYPDSDPASLLQTLRSRAKHLLEKDS
jgi:hypothetical protein